MKPRPSFIVACIAAISLLSACNRPSASMGVGATPTQASESPIQAPDTQTPIVGIVTETECYTGPGTVYDPVGVLAAGKYYQVVAIDDDVTWVDDDVTWFQIDPTAIIDPDAAGRPGERALPSARPARLRQEPALLGSRRQRGPQRRSERGARRRDAGRRAPRVRSPAVEGPWRKAVSRGSWMRARLPSWASATMSSGSTTNPLVRDRRRTHLVRIDDEPTWFRIDDEPTWFQIDPTAVIDPVPPEPATRRIRPSSRRCARAAGFRAPAWTSAAI